MEKLVIDTSILVKLFVKEEGREEVKKLVGWALRGEIELICPDFLVIELINVLLLVKKLDKKRVGVLVSSLLAKGIEVVPYSYSNWPELVDLMDKYDLTAYDAVYLWLAREEKCKLLTADCKLLRVKDRCVGLDEISNV